MYVELMNYTDINMYRDLTDMGWRLTNVHVVILHATRAFISVLLRIRREFGKYVHIAQ